MCYADIVTDASYCKTLHIAGWAAWIILRGERGGEITKIIKTAGIINSCTNSTNAEFEATKIAIDIATEHGSLDIILYSDCVEILKRYGKNTAEVKDFKLKLNKPFLIQTKHIPGHGIVENADKTSPEYRIYWCDRISRKKMREGRKEKFTHKELKRVKFE